ncbi:AAA domain-containing protein [Cryobacterium psychrotolerans]|uniref:AAA domain-containing protein n=1 Tax=Cryobacterium psychrotolerans TaxID=386301 RepID=A0A1G9E6M8_9MICO|nr:AAA domain-containing protein [Cryobacterium psychrotolerans]
MDWPDQLALSPKRLVYLTDQRGLTLETLHRFHIGHDGQRYTIPIQVGLSGGVRNVRRYLPGAPKYKMLNTPEHGTNMLAFGGTLSGNSLPVIVAEGEWDALLTTQEMAGSAVAITGTGGASNVPRELAPVANRELFIAYDCDDTGKSGALKFAAAARKVGATAYIIDLTRLGLPADSGEDLGDFFRKRGGTPAKLLAEMERLRLSGEGATKDDVLAAIEALFMTEDDARTTLIEDVRSDDDILAMQPARFVIDGWLPVGFFSDFFGEPGSRKTFAILDMLRHIRAGKAWHGHEVVRGATLLFEGEGLEQLQSRIVAWDEYHANPELSPGGSVSTPIDMTTPHGVARVVRTVRDFERQYGERVVVVAFDPLVEYMNGEENGEGMELVTRGLRALARYLDIAVVVGAHTNAAGERARGGDQLRMRSGAHVRVETLKGDRVGLVQEKQKNGQRLALQLLPNTVGSSLVLSRLASLTAGEYYADKSNADYQERATNKMQLSQTSAVVKHSQADRMLLDHVRDNPGVGKGKLVNACQGKGVGKPVLESRVDALEADGVLRVEREGAARNAASHYFLVQPAAAASEEES